MTKRRVPNVVRGGAAIPLKGKTNYYYMTGRKHTNGGIDIGQNPKTGIEVEDGEVMHITDNEVKIFSAVPFLNGESPAQKVMRGENANKVFNEQERFKKVNKIKDDGSRKKQLGGDEDEYVPLVTKKAKYLNQEPVISKKLNLDPDRYRNDLKEPNRFMLNQLLDSTVDVYKDYNGQLATLYDGDEMPDYYKYSKGYTKLSQEEKEELIKSYKKQLDYIGGDTEQSRTKLWNKLPKTKEFVDSIAVKYGISPELLTNRLNHEGFIDSAIRNYNKYSSKKEQKDFDNSLLDERGVYNGFKAFGLDNTGAYINEGKINLKDSIRYYLEDNLNEKKQPVLSADGIDVRSNIILQAATLEYMKKLMEERGIPKDKLETWTNAAFNMGPYHEDLKDSTFVENKYNFKKNRMGGKHNVNNKELNSNLKGFYSVTDRGKTKYYMIPSTGNSSARSAEVRPKKLLGDLMNYNSTLDDVIIKDKKSKLKLGLTPSYVSTDRMVNNSFIKPLSDLPDINYSALKKEKSWWDINKADIISDGIGLVSNIAGNLISHSMNKNMLNRLKPAPQPIARQAAKLKTQININPQLDKMRETVAAYERSIDNNTSSSNVALSRKQNARLANMLNTNELYGTKENIETELINKDRLNQQAVAEKNVTDYNKWATDAADFRNKVLEQKAENDVSLVNNLNSGIQNMLTVIDKRNAEKQTIAAMALANPNLPIEMFFEQGLISKKLYDAYRKAYPKENV